MNRLLKLWVVVAGACLIYVVAFGKLDEWSERLNPVPEPTAAQMAYSEVLQERLAARSRGLDAYQAAAIIREVFVDARRMEEIKAGGCLFNAAPSD